MRALGSQGEKVGGAVASLQRMGALDLLGGHGGDGGGVDTSETDSGITVEVSGTA
jgi:hypothetical protein